MSTTIDERVVEMRFDNKDFEKNVQTSMSTIEKLKQKLNFTGASKGLENVNKVAKRTDLSGISTAIETVNTKFSAMQVMGVTAIANITNSAVNAGKRITKALTIDPIKTGFQEYETQINAVQTILANTQSKGTTLEDVNKALDELNTYADKTIYNFTEMTRNIGTFTAAGVDLDKSVTAIKGIANLAAVSGSTSQQASTAMYQLSQALASGTVKLQDWNSVVNAGMGGQVFQDALKRTATQMGYNVDEMIKKYGSFRESLTQGEWLTAEVLTETLSQLAGAYSEADLIAKGYSKSQAKEIAAMAKTAEEAATKVKTFTQLWDTLKESVQSGWTQTWEILIGDFEEAKTLLTGISDAIGKVIGEMSEKRNNKLEKAMNGPEQAWEKLTKKIEKAGVKTEDFQDAIKKTAKKHGVNVDEMIKKEGSFEKTLSKGWLTKKIVIETLNGYTKGLKGAGESTEDMNKKLKEFQKVVNEVWSGKYGNGEERVEALTKAGYKYAEVQELVNKTVNGHKLKLEDLSNAQLKSVGYTDKEIKALRELEEQAKKTGTPISELIEEMSRPSGRELLIDSFKNIAGAISKITKTISEAWKEAFPEISANGIYKLIEDFNSLTESMEISDDTAEKLKTVFTGLFDAWALTWGVAAKGLVSSLKILDAVLGVFGEDILSIGAKVASWISSVRDWVEANTFAGESISKIVDVIVKVIEGIDKCIDAFLGLEKLNKILTWLRDRVKQIFDIFDLDIGTGAIDTLLINIEKFFTKLETWIKKIDTYDSFKEFGKDIVIGLKNGLIDGADMVFDGITDFAQKIIETFKNIMGIASPSKVFIALGTFLIMGLAIGMKDGLGGLIDTVKSVASTIVDSVRGALQYGLPTVVDFVKDMVSKLASAFLELDIDVGSIVIVGIIVGLLMLVKKLIDVMDKFANPLDKLGGLFDTLGDSLESLTKAKALNMRTDAIFNIAKAIALLAGSMYLLSRLSWGEIGKGSVAILAISAALVGLTFAASKMNAVEFGKLSIFMLSFSAAVLILSKAMKILSDIYIEDALNVVISLGVMFGGMMGVLYMFGKVVDNADVAKNMGKAGRIFTKMAISMMIMALAIKVIASIPTGDIAKGMDVIGRLLLMYAAIMLLATTAQYADGVGSALLKMSIAIAIIPFVIKTIAGISHGDIKKGIVVIAGVELMFAGIIYVSKFAGEHAAKAGSMLLKMSFAIGILAMIMKLIATMSYDDIVKGLVFIAGVEALFSAFILVSKLAKNDGNRAGSMLFKMAAGMALMGLAIKIIALTSTGDIVKGLLVITALEFLFGAMVLLTKWGGANSDKAGAMLLKMSAAILIITGAIALLSLLDPKDVVIGTAAISALLLCFAAIAKAASTMNVDMKPLIVIAATIGVLLGTLIGLTFIQPEKLKMATIAISSVLGMLSVLLVASKYAGQINVKSMASMIGVVIALAGVLGVMAKFEVKASIGTATALSILLLALSGALKTISKINKISKGAISGMYALSGVVLILGGILGVLAYLELESSIQTATSLSVLLLAITAALNVISTVTHVSSSAIIAMYALSGVVAILAIVMGVLEKLDVAPSIETAKALSTMLLSMAAVTAILAVISPIAAGAIAGAGAFAGVVAILGTLMIAIGALVKYIPSIEEFLDKGIEILKKIGTGIGEFVGSIVSGFVEETMSSLPGIGTCLSKFMTNVKPFIEGVKKVDGSVLKGVGILAASVLVLCAASLIESIVSFMRFGSSFSDLGTELSGFITKAKPFIDTVKSFTPEMFEGVKSLTQAILSLTAASVLEGITRFLPLSSSVSEFGASLPELGTGLRGFINNLGTFTDDQVSTVRCAGDAIKSLAKASEDVDGQADWAKKLFGDNSLAKFSTQLPGTATSLKSFVNNLGTFTDDQVSSVEFAADALVALSEAGNNVDGQADWAKKLFGDNSLSEFSTQLPGTATSLKSFVNNLGTFTDDQVTTVKCAGDAIAALAKAGNNVDGQADWSKALFGDNSLSAYATQLPGTATSLKSFVNNLGTFTDDQVSTVKCAGDAIVALSKAGNDMDGQADWTTWLVGDNSLSAFTTQFPGIATNLKNFVKNLGTFGDEQVATVNAVVGVLNSLAKLGKSDYTGLTACLPYLGDNLVSFAEDLVNFCDKIDGLSIADVNKITSSIEDTVKNLSSTITKSSKSIKAAGSKLSKALADGIKNETGSVKTAAKNLVNDAGKAIKEKDDGFKEIGKKLGTALGKGVKDKSKSFADAVKSVCKKGKTAIGEYEDDFETAGKDLGKGLVRGIKAKEQAAYDAGYALGKKAVQGEKDGQQSKSPSKLTYQAGIWLGEGLINGIRVMGKKVYNAGRDIGDTAAQSMTNAVSKIASVVDADMDVNPTIRPVLDLSDVKSGVGTIGSMFDNPSFGVAANINAISATMSSRNQNQNGNEEVVSAINKLRRDLGNVGNTSYIVNGITYDDGSNISNAVQALVDATRLGRRV